VQRNTVLWTIAVFFGASIVFSAIRQATEDESTGVSLLASVAALAVMVAAITLFVRRRGG
jgi:uncharacterized membrane protein YhaH (DUF805 family)